MNIADLDQLLILQGKDMEIARLKQALASLPEQRARLTKQMAAIKQRVLAVKQEIVGLDREIKEIEGKIAERRAYIVKMRTLQSNTRKNEEFQMCIHEVEKAEATIDELVTADLELMDKIEAARAELDAKVEKGKQAQKDMEELLARFDRTEQTDKELLVTMLEERAQLAAKVSEPSLFEYERMLKSKGAPVIVTLNEFGSCNGCHMMATDDTRLRVNAMREIVYCPSCHRVLH